MSAADIPSLDAVLRRDRLVAISGLSLVVVVSWIYVLTGAGMGMTAIEMTDMSMSDMARSAVMQPAAWNAGYAALMFFMWWVMMVAMMLPSASPMVLLFAVVNRKQKDQGNPFVPTGVFAGGYLIAWGAFSAVSTELQWGFEQIGVLSSMMVSTSALFGGAMLVAAGAYQLTPLKHACLKHCRSPMQFVSRHWRPGSGGALRMGLQHGSYCMACCWFLMGLLFVGGVMNLYWIAGLTLFVLLEKTIPVGHWLGSLTGVGLLLWGVWVLSAAG